MSQEDIHNGWTASYVAKYVDEKQEGQKLQVIKEDNKPGQLVGGEGVEGGQEGRKGHI